MYCSSCKTTKNLPPKPYSRYGDRKYYLCRDCNSRNQKVKRGKNRVLVYNHYGNKCNCCGEKEPFFLSIDHVNNDGNKHKFPGGRRVVGSVLYGYIIKMGYPDSYQILCMNCNFGKHKNNGVCPHKDFGI